MKKKKVTKSKPRIRQKFSENSWMSVNWCGKTKYGAWPAWNIERRTAHLDLIGEKYNSISVAIPEELQKPVAQLIGRLVNKYFSSGETITIEIRDEIIEKVKKYVKLTTDMMEKL